MSSHHTNSTSKPACPMCGAVANVHPRSSVGINLYECHNCDHKFSRNSVLPANPARVETGWINIVLSVN